MVEIGSFLTFWLVWIRIKLKTWSITNWAMHIHLSVTYFLEELSYSPSSCASPLIMTSGWLASLFHWLPRKLFYQWNFHCWTKEFIPFPSRIPQVSITREVMGKSKEQIICPSYHRTQSLYLHGPPISQTWSSIIFLHVGVPGSLSFRTSAMFMYHLEVLITDYMLQL